MLTIYVDADACPVKKEIFRVALRHDLQVYLVSNSRLAMVVDKNVHKIQVDSNPDAADDWICEQIKSGDIVVTTDILLADRCLKMDAHAISPTGKIFNDDNIGSAKAMRDLRAHLRETGVAPSFNAVFSTRDRARFLQMLEEIIQGIKRH
ncbi:YaiI/YqxD family protein [bacterium]|nr:MAG: YaiI/YqxD family protein [bacterium]